VFSQLNICSFCISTIVPLIGSHLCMVSGRAGTSRG